jgi:DNA-binding NtrC family response regulator
MSQPSLLIVDDEAGVRESLRMIFNKDFRILEAASSEVAIKKAQEESPEIVLLDIRLPGVGGLEVLRRIKEFNPHCQVIIITALKTAHTALTAKESGAFDYVVKPFDVAELSLRVHRALGMVAEKTGGTGK